MLAIWRYPVKAMLGELVDAVAVGLEGEAIEPGLSRLLGRRVLLERAAGAARGRIGATGAHHDAAPIHLLTSGTLDHLRSLAPESAWDVRRFRPNLVLDSGGAPAGFVEDSLIGARLRGAEGLELSVAISTPRCVVPTRAHQELPADPQILRVLVRRHRVDLGAFGRQGCAGAYAEVERAGRISSGERLTVEAAPGIGV